MTLRRPIIIAKTTQTENQRGTLLFIVVMSQRLKIEKIVYSSIQVLHCRATERHLLYGIIRCFLPLDAGKRTPP